MHLISTAGYPQHIQCDSMEKVSLFINIFLEPTPGFPVRFKLGVTFLQRCFRDLLLHQGKLGINKAKIQYLLLANLLQMYFFSNVYNNKLISGNILSQIFFIQSAVLYINC